MADMATIAAVLDEFIVITRKPVPDGEKVVLLRAWQRALADLPDVTVTAAAAHLTRSYRWPHLPMPADVIEAAHSYEVQQVGIPAKAEAAAVAERKRLNPGGILSERQLEIMRRLDGLDAEALEGLAALKLAGALPAEWVVWECPMEEGGGTPPVHHELQSQPPQAGGWKGDTGS